MICLTFTCLLARYAAQLRHFAKKFNLKIIQAPSTPPSPVTKFSLQLVAQLRRLRELSLPFSEPIRKLNSHTVASQRVRREAITPPLACRPKSRIKKYHVLSTSKTVFLHWNGLKSDLKHLLKHAFRGDNFSKIKLTNQ